MIVQINNPPPTEEKSFANLNGGRIFSKFDLSEAVFNWNHFEMRLLNLRINLTFIIYCGLFVLILVVFVLFLLSLRFGQISPLAFFT